MRVALVEDDLALRHALAFALEAIGHQVVAAATTRTLLAGLGDIPPDIMVADYRLGGDETGIDTINAVRTAFATTIPAIVLTGDTDPAKLREIVAHEVQVRHKPVQLDALAECLDRMT